MKLLEERKDFLKLLVELPEDLIILDSIIKENDIIGGKTTRVFKREKRQEKRSVYLKIRVEKKKFEGGRLRITGKIVEGPEDVERGHHTFELREGVIIEVFKRVDEFILKRIKESERFKKVICAVTLDYGKISVFEVRNYEIKEIFEKEFGIPGKRYPKLREKALNEFLTFVKRKIEELSREYDYVIVLGNKFLLEKVDAMYKIETPHYGITAIKELFRRREIIKILGEMDLLNAWRVYEEFIERLAKEDPRICYGEKDIEERALEGRVEAAVFTRDILNRDLELLKKIEEKGGVYYLVDEKTEVGRLVKNFGGIALLRY